MPSKVKHRAIHSLIKKKSPVILEIGAHTGTDTQLFIKHYPKAIVYCFEPDPRNVKELNKLNKLLNSKLNIVVAAAYSETRDALPFYQAHAPDSSSLKGSHPHVENASIIKVKALALDDWARKNIVSHVDLLWIDVQGAEREVLTGASNLLKNTDYIFIEYGEIEYEGGMTRAETIETLSDNFKVIEGYSSFTKKGDLVFVNKKLSLPKKILLESRAILLLKILKHKYLKLFNRKYKLENG